jgi:hypothetical protein
VEKTGDYIFRIAVKDKARLWIGDDQIIDAVYENKDYPGGHVVEPTAKMKLVKGKTYPVKLEFSQKKTGRCELFFGEAELVEDMTSQTRSLWIPPGQWQDAWTGKVLTGPQTITVTSDLEHTPIYAREGGIVFSTPLRMHSGTPVWTNLVVDAFVSSNAGQITRELYEDDGISVNYKEKQFSKTCVSMETGKEKVVVKVAPSTGGFLDKGFLRNWTIRLHLPTGVVPSRFAVNGKDVSSDVGKAGMNVAVLEPLSDRVFPFSGAGEAPGPKSGKVVEFSIPQYPENQEMTVELIF